jgi:ATP-dependent Clp protease ATP-binding subunit ClpB
MRFDKFTIKSQELIQSAQSAANRFNHQQIEPEHLLVTMLAEREGVANAILRKLGVSFGVIAQEATAALERLPKITGAGEVYLSSRAKAVLERAFAEADKMKDEYVSIEHILLAVVDDKSGDARRILQRYGVDRDAILKVLPIPRKSTRPWTSSAAT